MSVFPGTATTDSMNEAPKMPDAGQSIRDGKEAERILDSPVFRGAIQDVTGALLQRWKDATDMETREKAHAYMTALDSVVAQLRIVMQNGEIEEKFLV